MNTPKNETPEQEAQALRKPYEKPAITFRAPLEAVAGQCGIVPPAKAVDCTTLFS
jgi:hypothetical protein